MKNFLNTPGQTLLGDALIALTLGVGPWAMMAFGVIAGWV